jgi:hypothetical protein
MLYVLLNSPEVEPYKQEFIHEFWTASRLPEPHEIDTLISQGAGPQRRDFISWFGRKAQTDMSISSELCDVACGCELRVRSFTSYDVNGFRFHTTAYEESRPNRSTTNSGVVTIDTYGKEYHGRVLEIYELSFYGAPHLKPVIFKCHMFDPERTRRTPTIGLVEVRPGSLYPRSDVYIVAKQAVQVYYLPYACQSEDYLKGWEVVQKVTPHGKLPVPNDEDYNLINPNTYEGQFYQEEGLTGSFVIDQTTPIAMEVDNELVDHNNDEEEVYDPKDLQMLERLGIEHEENIKPTDYLHYLDNFDSDDERTDIPANPQDDPDYF